MDDDEHVYCEMQKFDSQEPPSASHLDQVSKKQLLLGAVNKMVTPLLLLALLLLGVVSFALTTAMFTRITANTVVQTAASASGAVDLHKRCNCTAQLQEEVIKNMVLFLEATEKNITKTFFQFTDEYSQNNKNVLQQCSDNSTDKLINIIDMLKNTSISTAADIADIRQMGIITRLEATEKNITKTLLQFADEYSQNNKNVLHLIGQCFDNSTKKFISIIDIISTIKNTSISTAEDITDIRQTGIVALLEATQNITKALLELNFVKENHTNVLNLIRKYFENSAQKLMNIVNTLNVLKGTSTSTAGVVDDILLLVEELLELQNIKLLNSIQTCKDIKTLLPNNATTGYYYVNGRNVYCYMGELCGTGGGWTRLAYLDMFDSTVNCPTGFRLYQSGGVRACGRPVSSSGSCSSVQYLSNGISYSQICGRVVGYQYYTPDAVDTSFGNNSIDTYYVDGVSITHGSPRQHVWTLMGGLFEYQYSCPCATNPGSTQIIPSFVGSHYFCEAGANSFSRILHTSDPLWDGKGCGSNEATCCSAPGLPWFHRDYNVTTTDYIELRVCGDEDTNNEDTPVSFYEIYVK